MIKKLIIVLFVLLIISITITSAIHFFADEPDSKEDLARGENIKVLTVQKLTMQEIETMRAETSMDRATAENLPPHYYSPEEKKEESGI